MGGNLNKNRSMLFYAVIKMSVAEKSSCNRGYIQYIYGWKPLYRPQLLSVTTFLHLSNIIIMISTDKLFLLIIIIYYKCFNYAN